MREACGYPSDGVEDLLGLILFVVYIACIIGIAAGVTWIVVRLSPARSGGDSSRTSGA
jgi:hypothetical protein